MADFLMDILEKPILHTEKLGDCQTDEDSIDDSIWEERIAEKDSNLRSNGTQQFTPDASPLLEHHLDIDFDISPTFYNAPYELFNSPGSDSSLSEDDILFTFSTSVPSPPSSIADFDMSHPNHPFTHFSSDFTDASYDISGMYQAEDDVLKGLIPENLMPMGQEQQFAQFHSQQQFEAPLQPEESAQQKDSGNKKTKKPGKVACEVCGKEFVNDWGVRRHTATAHPDPNTRNYRCEKTLPGGGLCTYKTYRHDHLLIHYKKHRGKH